MLLFHEHEHREKLQTVLTSAISCVKKVSVGRHSAVVAVAVVVVDLYSASHSVSNALIIPLSRKKMSFQRRSEAVDTPSRVLELV